MKAAVIGGGRMGLPLACVLAGNGAQVAVADIREDIVDTINDGRCPYGEPGLAELIESTYAAGRLYATTNTREAVVRADVIVVIVPAHLTPDRDIDFSVLLDATHSIGRGLRRGTLVIYETTVSVGGTRKILIPALEEASGLKAGEDFMVAFSPERVKANLVLSRLRNTPKVVGGFDDASRQKAVAFYSAYLKAPVDDVGTLEAAELTKLADMLYRDVNIALANELAAFAEVCGIDFELVRRAANKNGESHLHEPGIGVGGHCTPVYPYFVMRESRRLGTAQHLAEMARRINDRQPRCQLRRLAHMWGSLEGKRVHILGLAFRPSVKVDIYSPAYALREELEAQGALVTIEDPYYTSDEIREAGFAPAKAGVDPMDAVVLNTAHPEFADPDFAQWRQCGVQAVLDGRGLWDGADAEAAGILYLCVGKGASGSLNGVAEETGILLQAQASS